MDTCVHGGRDTATKQGQKDIEGCTINTQPQKYIWIRVSMEAEMLQ